jgi:mono/diheme cytochrome c family protein
MKPILATLLGLVLSGAALAAPFPKADPAAGAKLFDEAKCGACHAQRFGGDGSSAFTRPDRKVKSAEALLKQVRACVTQLNVQWFPDEEEHVAAYLNQRYYKFK